VTGMSQASAMLTDGLAISDIENVDMMRPPLRNHIVSRIQAP
jgi:hypothetical protein